MTPADHAATAIGTFRNVLANDAPWALPVFDALAERATELERERDRFLTGSAYEHLRERAEQLERDLAAARAEVIGADAERDVSDEASATWATLLAEAQQRAEQLETALREFVGFCETLQAEAGHPIFGIYERARAALDGGTAT